MGASTRYITVFGLGHLRPAPGTWGSLPTVALAAIMSALSARAGPWSLAEFGPGWWVYHAVLAAVLVGFSAACVAQGDAAEARWGKDPSHAVADEAAGQALPLMGLPFARLDSACQVLAAFALAFVAFRVLDIIKPWPARGIQRAPGGWGVLLDDLFAGLYAAAIVQVVTRVWM